jgi:hypothetical protein
VLIRSILRVEEGQHTNAFKLSKVAHPPGLSFSVVLAERTIDVVALNPIDYRLWVAGLQSLMRHAHEDPILEYVSGRCVSPKLEMVIS